MTLKTRRCIFWCFLVLFILAGTGTIFYSGGWRIDWENYSFQKTGAVFVKTLQKNAFVKIGDEIFSDKSGVLQSGTLIGNLLPKNYYVEVEKDGYQVWQKNVEVAPALVSKLIKIVLVPNIIEGQFIPLSDKLDDFYLGGKEEIVFKNAGGLYYNQKNVPLKLRGDKFVSWNETGDAFITADSAKNIHYLYRLNDLSKVLNVTASFNNLEKNTGIEKIVFHPADSDKIIVESEKKLRILDLVRLKLEDVNENKLAAWTVQNPNIYYLRRTETTSTALFSFNLVLKNETFLLDFGETDNIFLSPDKRKVVSVGAGDKISVYLLEDEIEELSKNKGEIIELDFYSDNLFKIKNIFWYKDSSHLLVEYADKKGQSRIDFIEIDSRLPINRYELGLGEKISYDSKSDRLYFIQENNLYFFDLTSF